jgi:hypothetical protein
MKSESIGAGFVIAVAVTAFLMGMYGSTVGLLLR